MVKICEVVDNCEECPRYGDDCDGDKMAEHTDLISRADAIDAVVSWTVEDRPHEVMPTDLVDRIKALPSADAVPQMEHDREWIIGCIKHDGFIKTDRFDKANQIIHDALSAEAEWIPCSDRLPEEKQEVYVTVYFIEGDTGRAYGYMDGFGKWHLYSVVEGTLNSGYEVIAWMPLPEPYKAESEVEE